MNNKIYIKELTIENWRNFNHQITLKFNDNFNEIKGMNGLGKTSILDAIDYMLFLKNSYSNTDFNESQYSENGDIKTNSPKIKLLLSFCDYDYTLETNDHKWFINGNKINSRQKYLEYLSEFLRIKLDDLFFLTKPNLLLDPFLKTQRSTEKQKIRDSIIQVVNSLSNEKIDVKKFEENTKAKEEIIALKKEKNNELKSKKINIESIKNINPNIENNNIIDDLELKQELQKINEKINRYSELQNKIQNLNTQIKDVEIKINNLNSNQHSNSNYQNKRSSINIWVAIFLLILGVIPGLIYIFVCLSKKNKNDDWNIDDDKNQSIESNNYHKEIDRLKKELEVLLNNDFYQSTDISELFNKKSEIEKIINSNNSSRQEFEYLKIQYSSLQKEIETIEKEIIDLKEKENKINEENKEIAFQTDKLLKNIFPDLSISLFNQKETEDIDIKKNGVPFKYLNHAAKQNILFKFNEILNPKKIIHFILIDHAESINEIYIPKNNQAIVCKVSRDNGLILNGKNIY